MLAPPNAPAKALTAALGIKKPKALIMLAGGADAFADVLRPPLGELFDRAVATAAIETGSIIIDGGTQSGVMSVIGEAVTDRGRKTILLRVAL